MSYQLIQNSALLKHWYVNGFRMNPASIKDQYWNPKISTYSSKSEGKSRRYKWGSRETERQNWIMHGSVTASYGCLLLPPQGLYPFSGGNVVNLDEQGKWIIYFTRVLPVSHSCEWCGKEVVLVCNCAC